MEMESPFFRRWYQQPGPIRGAPFHPTSVRGVPVYPVDPTHRPANAVHRPQEWRSGPKVVQIPVHFVGSEPADRTGSAVKIQKVFRGFFVRKCLKKVKDVRTQVDEIEEKISRSEIVELLRRDERERIRMNETLMSLLFKLDSICGVDFGVRGCRKAVTRKAIALQERIDAIVAADLEGNCENVDRTTKIGVSAVTDNSNNLDRPSGGLEDCGENLENAIGVSVETDNSNNPNHPSENSGDVVDCGENVEGVCCGEGNIIDVGVDWEVKNLDPEGVKSESDVKEKNDSEVNGMNGNRDLLERMVEESEKMTKMMSELYDRNKVQTTMLNALSHRVEMLEKAFLCNRPMKKKKKKCRSTTV